MSIAEWREMPKYEDADRLLALFPDNAVIKASTIGGFYQEEAVALRDRLRDTAAALDATLNEVDPPYADFRAILKRLKEEGLM